MIELVNYLLNDIDDNKRRIEEKQESRKIQYLKKQTDIMKKKFLSEAIIEK